MPESLPIDLQNLQKKVQSFIDDVLVNILKETTGNQTENKLRIM